jgi:hypothetical protein
VLNSCPLLDLAKSMETAHVHSVANLKFSAINVDALFDTIIILSLFYV